MQLQLCGATCSVLGGSGAADCQACDMMAPLAGLGQLTQLRLGTLRPAYLAQLPVQLLELHAACFTMTRELQMLGLDWSSICSS